jgi:hypothetical protein
MLAGSRVDSGNPQCPELPLLFFPPAVGIEARLLDGFLGYAMEL